MILDAQGKIDAAVGVGAMTSPLWLQVFDHATHIYFLIGGAILLAFRLASAIRDWRRK